MIVMVSAVTVGIPLLSWNYIWTTTSLGANDSVVTGHAWAHSVPRRRDTGTGGNDGFTAWQIRIRSLDRRLRLLAVLWRYSGQIALILAHGLHGWNILWTEKKILFGRKVVRLKPDQPDRRLRPCHSIDTTSVRSHGTPNCKSTHAVETQYSDKSTNRLP